ncbi:hypothetical protein KEC56_10800, partial [Microbacterium sp. YMB-B2]|nr:hypothetical protein [Microbacterium tenebrionis]
CGLLLRRIPTHGRLPRSLIRHHDPILVSKVRSLQQSQGASNIVGAALRDVIRTLEGDELPHNSELGIRVLQECAEKTLHACGVEVLSVMITGDALTDGHLLSQAMRAGDRHHEAVAALHALN